MKVASLELCKELYELTGWFHPTRDNSLCASYTWIKRKHTRYGYCLSRDEAMRTMLSVGMGKLTYYLPAYDLGYLLRKLPRHLMGNGIDCQLFIGNGDATETNWCADYVAWGIGNNNYWFVRQVLKISPKLTDADTPEDAACKLAIALAKANLLPIEEGKTDA